MDAPKPPVKIKDNITINQTDNVHLFFYSCQPAIEVELSFLLKTTPVTERGPRWHKPFRVQAKQHCISYAAVSKSSAALSTNTYWQELGGALYIPFRKERYQFGKLHFNTACFDITIAKNHVGI